MEFPTLKTDRFLLRQFVDTDLEAVYKGLSNSVINKYYGISCQSLELAKEQLKFFSDLEETETGLWWAICSLGEGTFYGAIGLNNLNKNHQKAELGFWLLLDAWHQGMIQETAPLICNYGFDNLNLHRIEAFVETENMACKKTMALLNFKHEGTMRDCEIKNGQLISLDIYSKLKIDK